MTHTFQRALMSAAAIGLAFSVMPAQAQTMHQMNHNSIQPETTLSISANAEVSSAPDIAFLNGGVISEAKTAQDALRQNANDMAGVFAALKAAGVPEKDIQTSNFSLNPRYEYPKNGERILTGYQVSNQVTAKVTDLDNVGAVIDAMVAQGGNSFSGVSFAVEDPSDLVNEARRKAIKEAMARAELYAEATGYKVARIVTIDEGGSYSPQPRPIMATRAMAMDEAAPTQISGGEITYSASVNVVFEFEK